MARSLRSLRRQQVGSLLDSCKASASCVCFAENMQPSTTTSGHLRLLSDMLRERFQGCTAVTSTASLVRLRNALPAKHLSVL